MGARQAKSGTAPCFAIPHSFLAENTDSLPNNESRSNETNRVQDSISSGSLLVAARGKIVSVMSEGNKDTKKVDNMIC